MFDYNAVDNNNMLLVYFSCYKFQKLLASVVLYKY